MPPLDEFPCQEKAKKVWRTYQSREDSGEHWDLVDQYLPLVKSIVGRLRIYFPAHVDIDDIYSLGITGLVSAVKRFDSQKAKSFGSYAATRIRGSILDELRRMDWMTRSNRARAKALNETICTLEQKLGRPAKEEEIAASMEMSLRDYLKLIDELRPLTFVPLNMSIKDQVGSENTNLEETLSDNTEENARERCEKIEMFSLIKNRIEMLDAVPRKVLILYYYDGLLLSQIADLLKITESRVCQIHAQAILSLRAYLQKIMQS